MKPLGVLWMVSALTASVACGGDAFTSGGGSGDEGSSSSGSTSSDSSSSSNSATTNSSSSSDGSVGGTQSSTSSATSASSGGSGGSTGGSAGNDTASSGGAGGSGGSGDSGSSNSSSGSGGSAGSGGNGGCPLSCELDQDGNGNEICSCKRPEVECESDADCTLANNIGVCCSGCVQAWPVALVEAEACLVNAPDWVDADCETPDCTGTLCPSIACEQVRYAACEDQRCVGKYECPDGMVFDHGYCVPPCEENSDCAIAYASGSCCGGCPIPVHREILDQDPCMVEYGHQAPDACLPDPKDCSMVGCPDVLCIEPGEAVCAEGGVCGTSSLL